MKITRVKIEGFHEIRGVDFQVSKESNIVCLTGDNGSGKSTLFGIISTAMGMSQFNGTYPTNQGFEKDGYASITLDFSDEPELEEVVRFHEHRIGHAFDNRFFEAWDREVTITIANRMKFYGGSTDEDIKISFNHIEGDPYSNQMLLRTIIDTYDSKDQLKCLHLLSSRDFQTEATLNSGFAVGSTEHESEHDAFLKKHSAWKSGLDLFSEWIGYISRTHTQELAGAYMEARRKGNQSFSVGKDYFALLNSDLATVIPGLKVIDVNPWSGTLQVERRDSVIDFAKLSAGEQAVIFLLGQIDRLGLAKGILLLDEPELHLNPELVRRLIHIIRSRTSDGQVWLATHSYEAIEAAGEKSIYLILRNPGCTLVERPSDSPVLSKLTSLIGRPGISISDRRFCFVEGGEQDNLKQEERNRYYRISKHDPRIEFVEIPKGKSNVLDVHKEFQGISKKVYFRLDTAAILDGDFTSLEGTPLNTDSTLYHLQVHEVENLFLHPEALACVSSRSKTSLPAEKIRNLIKQLSDGDAGKWIWKRTSDKNRSKWNKEKRLQAANDCGWLISHKPWKDIELGFNDLLESIGEQDQSIKTEVVDSLDVYRTLRESSDLWKHCFGKEVLKSMPSKLGLRDKVLIEIAILESYDRGLVTAPIELQNLRAFLGRVRP